MKKVLFITYYWPPSGKASIHWPLDIMNHLQNFGWLPIVLTTKDETFTEKDESLIRKVNPAWKIIRAKTFEPFNIYRIVTGKKPGEKLVSSETISKENKSIAHRLSIWIRMNLFIPDARIGWYLPAVAQAKKFLVNESIDAIVSIGPPHTTHLVARKLSKIFSVPYYPVFIDPWVDISYYRDFMRSRLTLKIDYHFEKSVVEEAKKIIFVTESMKDDFIRKYPLIEDKSFVLYWGYNEEDFKHISLNLFTKEVNFDNQKVIVHAGNIFDYQNPEMLWKEIRNRLSKGEKFRIKFIGTVAPLIKQSIKNHGLDSITEYIGFLPYHKMLEELTNADYLLVCATEKRHVPGKLFEYLRIGKPIIAFGDNNEEVKQILDETKSGWLFRYDGELKGIFDKPMGNNSNIEKIKKFDRKNIAEKLREILC